MELAVKKLSGGEAGKQAVGFDLVEEGAKGNQAVHDTVVAFMAAQRSGTAKAKDRGEVSGTGKKPWRQKGTGRARTGSRRTNIFTGGGVVHGPVPRDYSKKVNVKTRRLALRKALSERLRDGEVVVVDSLELSSGKTRDLHSQIKDAIAGVEPKDKPNKTVLLVTGTANENLERASGNLPLAHAVHADSLNTYEVLWPDVLIISQDGLEAIAKRLNK